MPKEKRQRVGREIPVPQQHQHPHGARFRHATRIGSVPYVTLNTSLPQRQHIVGTSYVPEVTINKELPTRREMPVPVVPLRVLSDELNDLMGKVPEEIFKYIRDSRQHNRMWSRFAHSFLLHCFQGRPSLLYKYQKQRVHFNNYMDIFRNKPLYFRRIVEDAIRHVRHQTFIGPYNYMSLADSCVETLTMDDDQWRLEMEHFDTMGKEYVRFLQMIYTGLEPTRDPRLMSKCAYIMLLDPKKYIFIDGLSLRQQYRLYLLAIFYAGEGNADEPMRKFLAASTFLAAGKPKNIGNTQVHLYEKINRDGWSYAYVVENVHQKVGAAVDTLILKHLKRWSLMENIYRGANIELFCDSLRESPVLNGLLYNTFLRLKCVNNIKN